MTVTLWLRWGAAAASSCMVGQMSAYKPRPPLGGLAVT